MDHISRQHPAPFASKFLWYLRELLRKSTLTVTFCSAGTQLTLPGPSRPKQHATSLLIFAQHGHTRKRGRAGEQCCPQLVKDHKSYAGGFRVRRKRSPTSHGPPSLRGVARCGSGFQVSATTTYSSPAPCALILFAGTALLKRRSKHTHTHTHKHAAYATSAAISAMKTAAAVSVRCMRKLTLYAGIPHTHTHPPRTARGGRQSTSPGWAGGNLKYKIGTLQHQLTANGRPTTNNSLCGNCTCRMYNVYVLQ